MEYIYGIDETCKSPVIGTLPVCIVKVDKRFFNRNDIRKLVIKDSKLTTRIEREVTYNALKGKIQYCIRRVYPYHMNENLIDLEVKEIIQGLRTLNYKLGVFLYIDSASTFFGCYTGCYKERLHCFAVRLLNQEVVIYAQ